MECGLKWLTAGCDRDEVVSLPARGVWIEICDTNKNIKRRAESLPARGVWIEIYLLPFRVLLRSSLPARGVWIEIFSGEPAFRRSLVTPRKGSVD